MGLPVTTGWISPARGIAFPGADAPWSTPGNIVSSNDLYATASMTSTLSGGETVKTNLLAADQFATSSDPNAPPDDATIVGIEVRVEGHHTVTSGTGSTTLGGIQVLPASGAGEVRGAGTAVPLDTDAYMGPFGSPAYAWGLSMTGADAKASATAVWFWVTATVDLMSVTDYVVNLFMDHVQIRYTWTFPSKGLRCNPWATRLSRRASI